MQPARLCCAHGRRDQRQHRQRQPKGTRAAWLLLHTPSLAICCMHHPDGARFDTLQVVTMFPVDKMEGPKAVICRCWKSGTFPLCDASHVKHNKETVRHRPCLSAVPCAEHAAHPCAGRQRRPADCGDPGLRACAGQGAPDRGLKCRCARAQVAGVRVVDSGAD